MTLDKNYDILLIKRKLVQRGLGKYSPDWRNKTGIDIVDGLYDYRQLDATRKSFITP